MALELLYTVQCIYNGVMKNAVGDKKTARDNR
jgi:hypothetical protein